MTFHAGLSAAEIGFYQALVLSPFLIFTIFGGVLTDRLGAGRSYAFSTTLFAAVLVGYGLTDHMWGYAPEMFVLYCLGAGIFSAMSNPAIDTFIPEAASGGAQQNGLRAAMVHNVAKLCGTISGLMLPVLLAVGGFVANGVLMGLSVLFLLSFLRQRPAHKRPAADKARAWGRIISHYRSCPENFDILLSSAMLGLLVVPAGYILWPLTLRAKFPEFGDLIALVNISAWVGAILITWVMSRHSAHILRPGRVSLLVWLLYAAALSLLTLVGSFAGLCLIVLCLGGVKLGKAMIYGKYIQNCPGEARGVLIAVEQTAFWGLATLGTFAMGQAVEHFGLQVTVLVTALAVGVSVLGLALRGRLLSLDTA